MSDEPVSGDINLTDHDGTPVVPAEKEPGPRTTRTATPKSSKAEKSVDQNACDELVRQIMNLDDRLAGTETEAVMATIKKGQYLTDLKAQAKRTWSKRLDELKLKPRVASRLMSVGGWGRENGHIEADLLAKLPQDVHKLEWLVKLSPEALQRFVEEFDCRGNPRATVIKGVKEALGQLKSNAESEDAESFMKSIEKVLKRLVELLGKIDIATPNGEAKERILGILGTAVEKLGPRPGS